MTDRQRVTRRHALAGGATVLFASAAGCTVLGSSGPSWEEGAFEIESLLEERTGVAVEGGYTYVNHGEVWGQEGYWRGGANHLYIGFAGDEADTIRPPVTATFTTLESAWEEGEEQVMTLSLDGEVVAEDRTDQPDTELHVEYDPR